MNNTIISDVTGSILDCTLADGIAVIVPPGMTALKVEGKMFFHKVTGRLPDDAVDGAIALPGSGELKYLLYIDNNVHVIRNTDDMRELVDGILTDFAQRNIRTIAMNGIRCDDRPDMMIKPEAYQKKFVQEYLLKNPGIFEKIYLVDLRSGFEKQI